MKYLILLCCLLSMAFAAQDVYQFTNPHLKQRFNVLTRELRCLVCQNQDLAESHAKLAADLRLQIYQKIQHGQSNQQIKDYMVQRYGDFVLYKPPVMERTWLLWFGPFVALIIGFIMLFLRKRSSGVSEDLVISDEAKQALGLKDS